MTTAATRQARTASVASSSGRPPDGEDDADEQRRRHDRRHRRDEHAIGDRRPHVPGARPAAGDQEGAARRRHRWPRRRRRWSRADDGQRATSAAAAVTHVVATTSAAPAINPPWRASGHSALSRVAGSSRAVVRAGRSASRAAAITTPPPTASEGERGVGPDVADRQVLGQRLPQRAADGEAERHADGDGDERGDRRVPPDGGPGLATGEAEHLEHGDLAAAPAGGAGDRVAGRPDREDDDEPGEQARQQAGRREVALGVDAPADVALDALPQLAVLLGRRRRAQRRATIESNFTGSPPRTRASSVAGDDAAALVVVGVAGLRREHLADDVHRAPAELDGVADVEPEAAHLGRGERDLVGGRRDAAAQRVVVELALEVGERRTRRPRGRRSA